MNKLLATITITMFLTGCERGGLTPAQCRDLANESYANALAEARADPTVWQFDGARNAQDYANQSRMLMLQICGG